MRSPDTTPKSNKRALSRNRISVSKCMYVVMLEGGP